MNEERPAVRAIKPKNNIVTVFGAGVSGLTAAHELAERGFVVRVVECDRGLDKDGEKKSMRIGGMAMTQYAKPKHFSPQPTHNDEEPMTLPGEHGFRFFPSYYHHLWDTMQRIPIYQDVVDPSEESKHEAANREIEEAAKKLELANKELKRANKELKQAQGGSKRKRKEEWNELREERDKLKGKIKALKASMPGREPTKLSPTHRTVFDNVMPCSTVSVISAGKTPSFFARRPPRSVAEVADGAKMVRESEYTVSDLNTYVYILLRYMCTCSARREEECEKISVLDYLKGRDGTGRERYRYSENFLKDVEFSPRVLAAMDATYGDARTNLSTLVQLLVNNMVKQPKVDGVLNGPTTEAWFVPWRIHLEELGVTFISAKLNELCLEGEEVVAKVTYLADETGNPTGGTSTIESDYFVVALDAPAAETVTQPLAQAVANCGVPSQLQGFTSRVGPDPREPGKNAVNPNRPRYSAGPREPWDRFQTLTGIQYFFDYEFLLVHGHIYFPTAAWGLSAIFEQDFWRARPTLEKDGYCGVLSVDIGAWNAPGGLDKELPSAAESTSLEIAKETWRQMEYAVGEVTGNLQLPNLQQPTLQLPNPHWYHLDEHIEFDDVTKPAVRNCCPYFIPIMNDFQNRPGGAPWDPNSPRRNAEEQLPKHVWRAEHGGYWVHWDKLVFAGTYKKTFTRLTAMEAACESGRHAANAIIDHYLYQQAEEKHKENPEKHKRDLRGSVGYDWNVPAGFTTERFLSPVYQPTSIGNYCQIWNIEEHELPDLEVAKRVDQWCFDKNLPHPWEMLGLDNLASLSSSLGPLAENLVSPSPTLVDNLVSPSSPLGSLFGRLLRSGLSAADLLPFPDAASLLPVLTRLREAIESLLNRRDGD